MAIRSGGSPVASTWEASDGPREEGFTLIEMMVVLLIMAILLAVAIPTFLGTTKGAEDKQTQANLTNALIAAKAIYVQQNGYPTTATMVSYLTKQEPELKYTTSTATTNGASTAATLISVYASGTSSSALGTKLIVAGYSSQSGVCWFVKDLQTSTATTKNGGSTPTSAGDWYNYIITSSSATCKAGKFYKTRPGTHNWTSSYTALSTGH